MCRLLHHFFALKKKLFLVKKKKKKEKKYRINSELCSGAHNSAHSTMERDKVMRE